MPNTRRVLDVNQWWLKGGVAVGECLAAFQPLGADSITQSCQNINGRGSWDAALTTTPTFAKTSGWIFTSASSQYITLGSGAIKDAVPLSMICLFQADNITSAYPLMSISKADTAHHAFTLEAGGATSGDPVRALSVQAGTTRAAATGVGYVADTWCVGAGVWKSATLRTAYIFSSASRLQKNHVNVGNYGTDTNSNTPAGADTTTIGYTTDTSTPTYHGGKIAACALYNIALMDGQVQAIAEAMWDLLLMANN